MIAPHEADATNWRGQQGESWAQRNPHSVAELDRLYFTRYGMGRSDLFFEFLIGVPREARVLEVGVSTGTQLKVLQKMRFSHLHGCDICAGPLRDHPFPVVCADACALPYDTGSFDLVFTSGTLMHVPPSRRLRAMQEIMRVSTTWVMGTEYWTPEPRTQIWQGNFMPPLWCEDFVGAYLRAFPQLRVQHQRLLFPTDGGAQIIMYLLRKA